MEKKRAVILFADILGSTEFAVSVNPEDYNRMLRAFHAMAHQVVHEYTTANSLAPERIYSHAVGDECHVFLIGGSPNKDEEHAMRLAVHLKARLAELKLRRELACTRSK